MTAKMTLGGLLLTVLLPMALANAQNGCPDPRATNYNPAAAVNDGTCQYATTSVPLTVKTQLASAVVESAGLQLASRGVWTINDSGNAPVLFKIDTTSGAVVQQVTITNFGNVDWEDIAADAQHLYVGDFGNNNGGRHDLRVLQIQKSAIGTSATESVAAQEIAFSYPDQTNFRPGTNHHNFDCEAFFYSHDSLHLFTKNWVDLRTNYYTVPARPGTHVAHFKGSLNTNGLITAADLNAAGTSAGLLGYNSGTGATFLWLLSDFRNSQFLRGNKRRIELPNALFIGQAEGLCFVGPYRVLISNEQIKSFTTVPPCLYALNLSPWLAPSVLTATRPAAGGFIVAPNPAQQMLRVARAAGTAGNLSLTLQDLQGRTIATAQLLASRATHEFNVAALAAGLYVLRIEADQKVFSQKIAIR